MADALLVFYDTEFSSIDGDADLLSVGFVSEDGRELYIELTDWDSVHCVPSQFVVDVVMPLLGRCNPERLTRAEASVRIEQWIDELRSHNSDQRVALMSDSALDWQFLGELFVGLPGQPPWTTRMNVAAALLQWGMPLALQGQFAERVADYFERDGAPQHHALIDARALRYAWASMRWEQVNDHA